jgi:hypothetical protein
MLHSIFESLFGCAHQRTTFPITPGKKTAGIPAAGALRCGAYVACLDCGKEFAYDWKQMRIGEPMVAPPPAAPAAAPVATAAKVQAMLAGARNSVRSLTVAALIGAARVSK